MNASGNAFREAHTAQKRMITNPEMVTGISRMPPYGSGQTIRRLSRITRLRGMNVTNGLRKRRRSARQRRRNNVVMPPSTVMCRC